MQVAAQAVEIRIFSAAGSSQSLSAVTDPRIAHNVIRRTTINALGHKWTNISPNFEPDLCGTATRPVGSFELTWHMEGRSKSWPDTFLVVEEADCDVILGRAASQKTTIGCYKGGYPAAITKLSKGEWLEISSGRCMRVC
jgi:hypothetical protein